MERIDVYKVFTPSTQAVVNFVERKNHFSNDFVDAVRQPGQQIIVYGHSGAGKSTLCLNKIAQLRAENPIITNCTSQSTYESIVLHAFDELNQYFVEEKKASETSALKAELSSEYIGIKSQIGTELSTSKEASSRRVIPIQLTAQRLADFLGAQSCIWVIEDFHKVPATEKMKLAQHLKVFVDASVRYPELKIILIGAVDSASQVIEYDPELRHRVAEICVPTMSDEEISEIVNNGERLLNVKFTQHHKKKIVKISSGLGAICHQICLNMCVQIEVYEPQGELVQLSDVEWEGAVRSYVDKSSATLKQRYDQAIRVQRSRKYENGKEIIHALARLNKEDCQRADILKEIQRYQPQYNQSNMSDYLSKLQTDEYGAVLYCNPNNLRYSFADPFIATFVKCKVEAERKARQKEFKTFDEFFRLALEKRLGIHHRDKGKSKG